MLNFFGRLSCWVSWAVVLGMACSFAYAQQPPRISPVLPEGVGEQKIAEFLSSLRPPAQLGSIESGASLKLGLPDIAASGPVAVQLVSEIPRTESMWLITLDAQPDGGSTLLASVTLTPSVIARVELSVNLYKSQHLMLLVRAGGRYHSVHRHIKIGSPVQNRVQK